MTSLCCVVSIPAFHAYFELYVLSCLSGVVVKHLHSEQTGEGLNHTEAAPFSV